MVDLKDQAVFKGIISAAGEFLTKAEAEDLPQLIRSLQQIQISRALELDPELDQDARIERTAKIAVVLESELFLESRTTNEVSRDVTLSYGVVGTAFEYVARLIDRTDRSSFDYWLRASLCYGIAQEDANSRFAARKAFEFSNPVDGDPLRETMAIILSFLSREMEVVVERSTSFKESLLKRIFPVSTESSEQNHLRTMGIVNLLESLKLVSLFLREGRVLPERTSKDHLDRAESLFHQSGDSYAEWLTSRLGIVQTRLVARSVWTLREVLPEAYLRTLTCSLKEPIVELWTSQVDATKKMFEAGATRHAVLVMPTSAGKTLMASMLLAKELYQKSGTGFYVAPSRALVGEVEAKLATHLDEVGIEVGTIPGGYEHVPALDNLMEQSKRVFVLTPEKLDLLCRLNNSRVQDSRVFVFDESQLVEEEGRGLRYELLVSKIMSQYGANARIIVMSATLPESNMDEFVKWIGGRRADCASILTQWKPTRLMEGVFFRMKKTDYRGDVNYLKAFTLRSVLPPQKLKIWEDTVKLAWKYKKYLGPVLIFCRNRGDAERTAIQLLEIARKYPAPEDDILKHDVEYVSNILGKDFPLVKTLRYGIAYHHAALPTPVRHVVERLARDEKLSLVASTSTLLEGVNLSVKTVIISSGYAGDSRMSGADFENLAGRAGRALRDTEGHVILTGDSFVQDFERRHQNRIQSRFFQYLDVTGSEEDFSNDTAAVEAELLVRLYHKQLSLGRLTEDVRRLMDSTLFSKQATRQLVDKAETKVSTRARFIINQKPPNEEILRVFAETGLGIQYCARLEESARAMAKIGDLRFRIGSEPNWTVISRAVEACLLPSERLSPRARKTVGNQVIAVQKWLSGQSFLDIASEIAKPTTPEALMHISHYFYLYVGDDVSWACAAFVRLLKEHVPARKLDSEWELLPSYLRWGVISPSGLLLALAGMDDRDSISSVTAAAPVTINDSGGWIRQISWVLSVDSSIQAQIGRVQNELLSKVGPFSLPATGQGAFEGVVEVESDGRLSNEGRTVGTVSMEFMPLLSRLKGRARFQLTIRADQILLTVTPLIPENA